MSYNLVFMINLKLYLIFVVLIIFIGECEWNDIEKNGFEFECLENLRLNS